MHDHPPTDATLRRRALLGEDAVRCAHEQAEGAPEFSPEVTASLEALLSSARQDIGRRAEQRDREDPDQGSDVA